MTIAVHIPTWLLYAAGVVVLMALGAALGLVWINFVLSNDNWWHR